MADINDVEFVDTVTLVGTPSHRRPLMKAQLEGRLHPDLALLMGVETGQFVCPTCGMRSWTDAEAKSCCEGLVEGPITNRAYGGTSKRHHHTRFTVTNGGALASEIRRMMGAKTNKQAEVKLGLHIGYLSKLKTRNRLGLTEETHAILKRLFGGEVPFVGVK